MARRGPRQTFGDLSEDASMAAVVAELARITEEHPYLTPDQTALGSEGSGGGSIQRSGLTWSDGLID